MCSWPHLYSGVYFRPDQASAENSICLARSMAVNLVRVTLKRNKRPAHE
jgi:hypothetical protein